MFESLRLAMEAEAAQRGTKSLTALKFFRLRNIAHWLVLLSAGSLAFVVLLGSEGGGQRGATAAGVLGFLLGLVVVLSGELLRTNARFLQTLVFYWFRCKLVFIRARKKDFLALHFWTACALVVLPVLVLSVLLFVRSTSWTYPSSNAYKDYQDTLKQLATFTLAVLAAQIALFNFMFGQFLGKYSSALAGAINKHRVVLLLRWSVFTFLVAIAGVSLVGFPNLLPRFTLLLFLPLLSSLFLTLWVAQSGLRSDAAVVYVGEQTAAMIRRLLPRPIFSYSRAWKFLASLALDWRNPEAMVPTVVPTAAVGRATPAVAGLLNAAHKSIQENQHEIFTASLEGIRRVVEAYAKARTDYLGTDDSFLSYLSDQLAGVLKAAAISPNQYLISDAVRYTGVIGGLVLGIGELKGTQNGPDDDSYVPRSHPMFAEWLGVLMEGFYFSHTLLRSKAASEALVQMGNLAESALARGYGENALLYFPEQMKLIHAICLVKGDAYHMSLASQCLRKMLDLWLATAVRIDRRSVGYAAKLSESVLELFKAQQVIQKLPSFDLSDVGNVLTSRLGESQVTIQGIFAATLQRPLERDWEVRTTIDDLIRIIHSLGELTDESLKHKLHFSKNYIEALFEIWMLIARGLPEVFSKKPKSRFQSSFADREFSPCAHQEKLESELFGIICELFKSFYNADKDPGNNLDLDWLQDFHSIVGVALVIARDRSSDSLRSLARDFIEKYLELVQADKEKADRVLEEHWDYLQLCAAWICGLAVDEKLANDIITAVAYGREFSTSPFSGGSKSGYGLYGYPNLSLGQDFFLTRPRNITEHLEKSDYDLFRHWESTLMDHAILMSTAQRVEELRRPLWDQIIERRKKAKTTDPF